ncbi:hypothetical protein Mgra_00000716 [Meloidogyne graminicola]|uniref:Uncharacterized protein n=1 Tax=Meloidogyne graminicola TaxID=189291 RepID=A0A8T0A396_9BILA|nr:hypothetical protein Mgra_00000716 [Meloidogyne graminicola]
MPGAGAVPELNFKNARSRSHKTLREKKYFFLFYVVSNSIVGNYNTCSLITLMPLLLFKLNIFSNQLIQIKILNLNKDISALTVIVFFLLLDRCCCVNI